MWSFQIIPVVAGDGVSSCTNSSDDIDNKSFLKHHLTLLLDLNSNFNL